MSHKLVSLFIGEGEYYTRSDADNVIAELKDDCAYWITMSRKCADDNEVMAKQRAYAFERERHQKFKRCLAMARWCVSKVYNIRRTPLSDMSEHEYWQYENDFWQRWQKRWMKLGKEEKR